MVLQKASYLLFIIRPQAIGRSIALRHQLNLPLRKLHQVSAKQKTIDYLHSIQPNTKFKYDTHPTKSKQETTKMSTFKIRPEKGLDSSDYDGIIGVHCPGNQTKEERLVRAIGDHLKIDPTLEEGESAILPLSAVPAGRFVVSSTGALDPDYDDVRSLREAAFKATKKALKIGVKRPLVYLQHDDRFENAELMTLIGALEALYVPLQAREMNPCIEPKIDHIGVVASSGNTDKIIELAKKLEAGLRVAKDIGDADPERMAPPRVQEYVEKHFANSAIKVKVIEDVKEFEKDYPLFEAVNRCASVVERHRGRIIFLEYSPCTAGITETLLLVGKGVTYDTGGADIKAGGVMAGMSRDKCGAAAVAGFMEVCNQLKPQHCKVVACLGMVRNSVGSNAYVADELIKSRAGVLVRVGNTDAEGRMILADPLCRMKEIAVDAVNPHLFTIATLTGHAHLAVGNGYSIVIDNGPAQKANNAQTLQKNAEAIGDPFEISTVRREDFAFIEKGKCVGDGILQCNNAPSSRSARGHQFPAAFLIKASGLDKHGSGSTKPLKYSHLDIAASAGDFPDPATGSPILALAQTYLLKGETPKSS